MGNAASAPEDLVEGNLREARKLAKDFGVRLRDHLMHSLQEQGPIGAIDSCHFSAPGISNRLEEMHITVRRTSLKLRNPDNKPDAWETRVLEFFAAEQAAGADAANLEHYALIPGEGGWQFRYSKAIPTGPVCLSCHGEDLAPEVQEAIKAKYPNDLATGYRLGEVRGAFSITIRGTND
jgi:hypothetical protein